MARMYVAESGDFEQAEEHFSQASRGKRWGTASRDALESLKELEELRQSLSETGSARLWLRAAECYLFALEVPESALVCYRNAAGMDDSLFSPRASLALARLFERLGYDQDAREVFQELVGRYPSSQQAAQARAALSDTTQHVAQAGQGDPVRYQEAERALLGGDYETALTVFRSLADEATDERWAAKARFAEAWLLQEKLARTDEAKRAYELVAGRFPSSSYAREASRRLGTALADTVEAGELRSAEPREPLVARCDTTESGALRPVIVRVRVRATGRADEVVLVEGSGSLTCDETALDVARRAHYQPRRSGDEPTEGWWEGQIEVLGLLVERPPDIVVVEPEESTLDTLPSFSTYVPPTYPPGLLVLAEGEDVVLALGLDEKGAVSSTKIEQAPEAVRQLVLQTVALWRFTPAYARGEAVACRVRVRFVVKGKER
jgi:TonB family protein